MNEAEIASACARLQCPHPYLALETVDTPKVVWWLNEFRSPDHREFVERAYAANQALMADLHNLSQRKGPLTLEPTTVLTTYRPDLSRDAAWKIGATRFFVVTVSDEERKGAGVAFEAPDGRYFFFVPAPSRQEADQISESGGSESVVLAVNPLWSFPAATWVSDNPELWASRAKLQGTR